jgi:hypothetical protein
MRPSDPWFDKDYRVAKRLIRWLEPAFAAANRRTVTANAMCASATETPGASAAVVSAAAAKAAWYKLRRSYPSASLSEVRRTSV